MIEAIENLLRGLEHVAAERDDPAVETLASLFRVTFGYVKTLEKRVELLELAVRGLAYEPAAGTPVHMATDDEADTSGVTRLLGIPVDLRIGITNDQVRAAYDALPPGLSRDQAIDALVSQGLVTRAPRED